jgi:general secretion pathway protein J
MSPAVRDSSTAGFTLLEALIATAMMAMILAALATITRQWLPNWNRGVVRVQSNDQLARALERVSDDLAATLFVASGPKDKRPFFNGGETSVTFVRTALGPNAGIGLEFVRLAEAAGDAGPVLLRTRSAYVPNRPPVAETEARISADPVVLLRRPYRLLFAYAGPDRAWQVRWQSQHLLPETIRLTIQNAATTTSWTTVVSVRARTGVECLTAQSPTACLVSEERPGDAQKSL